MRRFELGGSPDATPSKSVLATPPTPDLGRPYKPTARRVATPRKELGTPSKSTICLGTPSKPTVGEASSMKQSFP